MFIEHISNATRHAGGKITPGFAENQHATIGHVFAAVITHAFNYDTCTAVPYAETFARHTPDISFSAGSAIKCDIANDNIFLTGKCGLWRRIENEFASR